MRLETAAAWVVLAAALLLGLAQPSQGAARGKPHAAPSMPGPARHGPAADRIEQNRECIACHVEIAAQWEGSLHQRSFVDQDVSIALARQPRAFCRSCHAPEANPQTMPSAELGQLGVACVTCHVPPDATLPAAAVLGAPAQGVTTEAPHPVVRSEAFAGTAACGRCHEFAAPREPGVMLQSTLSEHRSSAFAADPCQSCHMPRGRDGRRAHGFAASRDPAMLRSALRTHAWRRGDDVVVELAPGDVGHAFPTGDLFRRLSVELGHDDDGAWTKLDAVVLTRHIETRSGGHNRGHSRGRGRVQVADDRPGASPDPTRVPLHAPGLTARTLRWRVVYERVDMDHPEDDDPRIFARVIVAEGHLPPSDVDDRAHTSADPSRSNHRQ